MNTLTNYLICRPNGEAVAQIAFHATSRPVHQCTAYIASPPTDRPMRRAVAPGFGYDRETTALRELVPHMIQSGKDWRMSVRQAGYTIEPAPGPSYEALRDDIDRTE